MREQIHVDLACHLSSLLQTPSQDMHTVRSSLGCK